MYIILHKKNGLSNSKRTIYDRLIQAEGQGLPEPMVQQGRQGRRPWVRKNLIEKSIIFLLQCQQDNDPVTIEQVRFTPL